MSNHLHGVNTSEVNFQFNNQQITKNRLIPVPNWNKYHEWPTQAGLRYWIFHAKANGFDSVIRRIGRRILIDESAFFQWIQKQNQEIVK